ncbi:MAG: hypothetical protein M1434_14625 [Chloroflexi bacterium]|nr:hypothetical protein [Chloroflexota bacterium]MCL5275953.1 hypothetical protein [Chloroflexota bacterium]
MTSLEQFRHIADAVGPRSGASDEEATAAGYIAERLSAIGLAPNKQIFLSPTSAYAPAALFAGIALLSVFLFWQGQPVGAAAAALLTATALISLLLEMQYRANPLRWVLPIEESQNVYAHIPRAPRDESDGAPAQTIVISAHLDVQRNPAVFNALGGVQALPALLRSGLIAAAVLLVLFLIGIPLSDSILRQIALLPGVVLLVIFILMLLAQRAPYRKGEGDNAGGLAVLLDASANLTSAPLAHADTLVVFTGASEVGGYGMQAFLRAHQAELAEARQLIITAMGAAGTAPAIAREERSYAAAASDRALLALAGDVVAAHPDLGAVIVPYVVAHGEFSLSARYGLRPLALTSTPQADPTAKPPADASIMPATGAPDADELALQRATALVCELARSIDAAAGGTTAPTGAAA